MAERDDGYLEFEDVVCIGETAKAIFVVIEKDRHWIPQSQVHDDSEVYKNGTRGTLVISQWIAQARGLA